MTDRGLHPRNLSELIDNWEWTRDETLGEQIQEAAEGHGLLSPALTVIRTMEELESLDPYTMVLTDSRYTAWYAAQIEEWELPAVVIREGSEVRAAREALEEE